MFLILKASLQDRKPFFRTTPISTWYKPAMDNPNMAELGRALLIQLTSCNDRLRDISSDVRELLNRVADETGEARHLREKQASPDGQHRTAHALTEITAELSVINEHLEDQTRAMQLFALAHYKGLRMANGPRHDFPTSMPESFSDVYEKLVVRVLNDVFRNG